MYLIARSRLPAPEAELRSALEQFKTAKAAHRTTVGVPAPLPAFEVLNAVWKDQDQDFAVVDDDAQPSPAPGRSPVTAEQLLTALERRGVITREEVESRDGGAR